MAGFPESKAQDSLQTRDVLFQKMKRYANFSSPAKEHKAGLIKSSQALTEKDLLNYYDVHAASTGNKLKLFVVNNMDRALESITIQIINIPPWISPDRKQKTFGLSAKNQTELTFSFDIAPTVSVGQKGKIELAASGQPNDRWTKQIAVEVTSPGRFKLLPNYPNPFNPSTNIQYNLPARMHVRVAVYNMLGRRVAILVDKIQEAGPHELRWDASRMASGLYFYQIIADGKNGRKIVRQKKMMLIK